MAKTPPTAQHLSKFAREAQIAAKKEYGFEPSIKDIQEATPSQALEISRQTGLAAEELRQARPLGPDAGKLARINPAGELERPLPSLPTNQATMQEYRDISSSKTEFDQIPPLNAIRQRIRQLHVYAQELFTAQPGFFNVTGQARDLLLAQLGRGGAKTKILGPNGQPLTTGELMSVYERERLAIAEALGRSINQVKGAGTEPDVNRQLKALGGRFDTANIANQLFVDLDRNVERITGEILTPIFGQDAAGRYLERQRSQMTGTPATAPAMSWSFDQALDAIEGQFRAGQVTEQAFRERVQSMLMQSGIAAQQAIELADELSREVRGRVKR